MSIFATLAKNTIILLNEAKKALAKKHYTEILRNYAKKSFNLIFLIALIAYIDTIPWNGKKINHISYNENIFTY